MNSRLQVLLTIGVVLMLFLIITVVKKKQLELKYALPWIMADIFVFVLNMNPVLLAKLAKVFGIILPSNMMFFIGFCFSLFIIFLLTVAVSRLSDRVKELTQQLAILEKKQREFQVQIPKIEEDKCDL